MSAVKFVRETEQDVYFFFDSYLVTASKTCAYTLLKRKHQRKVSYMINVKRNFSFKFFIPFSPFQKGNLAICPCPVFMLQNIPVKYFLEKFGENPVFLSLPGRC